MDLLFATPVFFSHSGEKRIASSAFKGLLFAAAASL